MHTKQPLCYWLLLAPCALPDTLSPPTFRSCHHYRLPLRLYLWASNSISNPVLYILTTRTYLHLQTHAPFFTSYHNTAFTRAQLHTECSIDNRNHQPVITLMVCIYLTFTLFFMFLICLKLNHPVYKHELKFSFTITNTTFAAFSFRLLALSFVPSFSSPSKRPFSQYV